jgi:hypothetical protein
MIESLASLKGGGENYVQHINKAIDNERQTSNPIITSLPMYQGFSKAPACLSMLEK